MSNLHQKHEQLKRVSEDLLSNTESFDDLAKDVLHGVVLDTIKKYQQKLSVGVQDSVADLLDAFKVKIKEVIIDHSKSWRLASNEPFVFPKNCRFCFSIGRKLVVVIEQDPQVRTINIGTKLLGELEEGRCIDFERLTISLPYSVFVFVFEKAPVPKFMSVSLGWRTSPIATIQDCISQPLLPNIHNNFTVCLGQMNPGSVSLSEQVDVILDHFWCSRFNQDLSENWWAKKRLHQNLKTGRSWAEASINDPLFILGVNLENPKSLNYVIKSLTQNEFEIDETRFNQNLSEQIDKCANGLFAKISQYFKKNKFEKHEPKDVVSELSQFMKKANADLHDLTYATKLEIDDLVQEIAIKQKRPTKVAGAFWSNEIS